jgi:MFS family permease
MLGSLSLTANMPPWELRGARQWTFLWLLSLAQLVSWGIFYYAFAVYMAPMERELGWSRAELNGALTGGLLVSGLCAPWVGAWIDRHGPRGLMTIASLVGGGLLIAWSQVSQIEVFYVIFLLLGAVMSATLYEPAFAVLTHAFPRDYRRAITLMTLVGGLASTAFIPLSQWLIEHLQWRPSLLVLSAISIALCFLVHLLVLPAGWRPEHAARATAPATSDVRPVRRALRSPAFWALGLSFTAYALVFTGLTFHLVPLLDERQVPMETILLVYALIGPLQVAGRIVVLGFSRHLDARTTGNIITGFFPISIAILLFLPPSLPALLAFVLFYGSANGIITIVRGTIVQEVLGTEGIGAVNGLLALPSTGARAGGPLIAALLWQVSGNYHLVLWAGLGSALVAAMTFWLAVCLSPARPSG